MKSTGIVLKQFWAALVLAAGVSAPVFPQTGVTGDVNRDGAINVLDVQNTVNIALGQQPLSPEADVDENAQIDVLDIQTIANTAIGTGGLHQEVTGVVQAGAKLTGDPDLRILAVALDGRTVEALVRPATGQFRIRLAVRTSWTLNIVARTPTGPELLGTLQFRVAGQITPLLPLPELSRGVPIDLGALDAQTGVEVALDLRSLIAAAEEPLPDDDGDANGLADVLDELIRPYLQALNDSGLDRPLGLRRDRLVELIRICLVQEAAIGYVPDLTGIESDLGIPSFLEPVVHCVHTAIVRWFNEAQTPVLPIVQQSYHDFSAQWLRGRIRVWLGELDRPALADTNNNNIPDHLEDRVCLEGTVVSSDGAVFPGACALDRNGDGFPDFTNDSDSDGIADVFDTDFNSTGDLDRDGIPDEADLDDDGDGMPDYADPEPQVPGADTLAGQAQNPGQKNAALPY
ncbi:MAG: hypothetical protein HYV27_08180 [Candidatus Hydrogenedentes bacterium]|nr:hypothetical protein [Candidatus Hydrogenedentota bacterium]